MEFWSIILNNYEGCDEIYYFNDYSVAKETFEKLCEKYSNYDEFDRNEKMCEWLDSDYNEFPTIAILEKSPLYIFNEVLDL